MNQGLSRLLVSVVSFIWCSGFCWLAGWSPAGLPRAMAEQKDAIKIMIVTGGCCHDYEYQSRAIQEAFETHRVSVQWRIVNEGGRGTEAEIKLYDDPNWAQGYDVIIHNECFANTTSPEYIRNITRAHQQGANAVVIHCAMHTYRASKVNDWREFLGVTSRKHEHQSEYPVKVVAADHPIMRGFPRDWVTPKDELYIIETIWPQATPLATSTSEKDGRTHPCFWVNEYGKSRVFGTTYGHSNETFADEQFRRLLVRGSLWAAGKLQD